MNGRIWLSHEVYEGGLSILGDRIDRIGRVLPEADETIDAQGNLVLPGFIDVHVHMRDFNYSYKEDYSTGTSAAVAGGFTTLLDMPNTEPVASTREKVEERQRRAEGRIFCDLGFHALPQRPEDVVELVKAGVYSIKIFTAKPLADGSYPTRGVIEALMRQASALQLPTIVHAEDPLYLEAAEGEVTAEVHGRCHPSRAEVSAVRMVVECAERVGAALHIAHISTCGALKVVEEAKGGGCDVSCEATPHHCLLDATLFNQLGPLSIVEPPLRSGKDRRVIMEGVESGGVPIIASDHAPHSLSEKFSGDPKPGFPGLETTFALFNTMVQEGGMSFNRLLQALTVNPASRFSLNDVGEIRRGYTANITIVDPVGEWRIEPTQFFTKAKYSPFEGRRVRGRVVQTIVYGIPVYQHGEITASPGVGRIVRRAQVRS